MSHSLHFVALFVLLLSTTAAGQDPDFEFTLDAITVGPDEAAKVTIAFANSSGDDVSAYQLGVCHNSEQLSLYDGDVTRGSSLDDIDFLFETIEVFEDEEEGEIGFLAGALLEISPAEYLEPGEYPELYHATYTPADDLEVTSDLEFCGIGLEPPNVMVIVDNKEVTAVTVDGSITVSSLVFLRGDVDASGSVVTLVDAIALLAWSFADGATPPCLITADVDGDDEVSAVVDAVYLLEWGYVAGDAPPHPGPNECGTPGETDTLGCDEEPDCP